MSLANASLYSPSHPQVARMCAKAFDSLREALQGKESLSFLLFDEQIVVDNQPLTKGPYAERVLRIFREKGIEHVEFSALTERADLQQLIANLLDPKIAFDHLAPCEHVRLGRLTLSSTEDMEEEPGKKKALFSCIEDLPLAELRIFAEIYEKAKKRQNFSLNGLSEMVSGLIGILREDMNSFLVLSALQSKDKYTFTHSTNVCILNLVQAISLRVEGRLLHDIGIAGMLHDVGKLFIPEEILCKPDKLDEKETSIMRQHPARGAEYLYGIPNIPSLAVSTAYEHHIGFNGDGYPRVPADWPLNLCSHITSISDIFDAMRTKRSYQPAKTLPECKEILLGVSGSKLHPALTRHFLSLAETATTRENDT